VADKIREVETGFQLVMLAERFPESLVLLASTLCWDLQDVTSLKLNGRPAERRQELSNVTRQQLRQFQRGDTLLYNHFAELFDQRVQKFGRARMAAAVLQLEAENRAVAASCSVQPEDNRRLSGEARWWGPGLVGYRVTPSRPDCAGLVRSEPQYVNRVRRLQQQRDEEAAGR